MTLDDKHPAFEPLLDFLANEDLDRETQEINEPPEAHGDHGYYRIEEIYSRDGQRYARVLNQEYGAGNLDPELIELYDWDEARAADHRKRMEGIREQVARREYEEAA